jgi:hypothetical protein
MADAANQLPTIATAGAPADLVGFQQHHAETAFGQLQRRVQPRKPTADHAYIGDPFACEHRMIGLRQAAGGVIRGDVLSAGIHARNPDFCVSKI